MNRFGRKNNSFVSGVKKYAPVLIFIIVICIFLFGITFLNRSSVSKQKESLESALNRSIVQCYSIEGTYPPSLSYIQEHYGLTYNEDLFFVDYIAIGANLLPDYTVIVR